MGVASATSTASKKRAKLDISSVAKPHLRLDLTSVPPPEEFDTVPHDLVEEEDLTGLHHSPIHTCGRKTPASPKHAQEQLQRDRLELLGPGQFLIQNLFTLTNIRIGLFSIFPS